MLESLITNRVVRPGTVHSLDKVYTDINSKALIGYSKTDASGCLQIGRGDRSPDDLISALLSVSIMQPRTGALERCTLRFAMHQQYKHLSHAHSQ